MLCYFGMLCESIGFLAPDDVLGRPRLRGFALLLPFDAVKFWSIAKMMGWGLVAVSSTASYFRVIVLCTLFSTADCWLEATSISFGFKSVLI